MTGLEICTGALEMIGAYSTADGDLPGPDGERALFHANLMRKSWNARNLVLHTIERQPFTWTAAASSRTIGPSGADLTGTRPLQVLWARVIPSGQTSELKIDTLTAKQYADIPDKTQTADYFTSVYYEPTGASIGTLKVWPVPTTAPTLILHNKALLAAITLADEVVFPESYEAVFVSQLAKRLAPVFGRPWTADREDIAREDLATVQRANIRIPEVQPVRGLRGSPRGVRHSDLEAGLV